LCRRRLGQLTSRAHEPITLKTQHDTTRQAAGHELSKPIEAVRSRRFPPPSSESTRSLTRRRCLVLTQAPGRHQSSAGVAHHSAPFSISDSPDASTHVTPFAVHPFPDTAIATGGIVDRCGGGLTTIRWLPPFTSARWRSLHADGSAEPPRGGPTCCPSMLRPTSYLAAGSQFLPSQVDGRRPTCAYTEKMQCRMQMPWVFDDRARQHRIPRRPLLGALRFA